MDHVNKYHLINVLDEDLRIVKVMTEQEVFDAIMLHNANATFDILLEKSH
jgi:stage IV sporulation protein FB